MSSDYIVDGNKVTLADDPEIFGFFYKENRKSNIWWVDLVGCVGIRLFSFDKKKIYCLFEDYPHNLTPEEKEIFDKENPYWKNFFSDRQYRVKTILKE